MFGGLFRVAICLFPLIGLGCIKPNAQQVMDIRAAVTQLEGNGGKWTPEISDAVAQSLADKDWRIQSRGLAAVSAFPTDCPETIQKLVQQLQASDPSVPGLAEAMKALGNKAQE